MDALTADNDVVLASLGGKPVLPEDRLAAGAGGAGGVDPEAAAAAAANTPPDHDRDRDRKGNSMDDGDTPSSERTKNSDSRRVDDGGERGVLGTREKVE